MTEESLHRAGQPAARAAIAGQGDHAVLDRTDVVLVLVQDMAEQPAREQVLELLGDILTSVPAIFLRRTPSLA